MKKHLFKSILVLTVLLFCSTHVWAWYVPGNLSGSMRDDITANNMNGDNKITFFAVPAGTYKLQLTNGSSWSGNGCVRDVEGCTKGTDGTYATITITAAKNITVSVVDETYWKVKVSATDPCTYIKYGWNGGDWSWSNGMNPYGNGKYACVGQYSGGNDFNYQVSSDEEHYNDGKSNVTVDDGGTAFSKGDWCVFVYDVTSSRENPSLTIQRCSKVTPTNYVYFDNTESNWSDSYIYFMIGRPVNASTPYLATYQMTAVANTKLYRYINTSETWSDADYYAVGGRSAVYDSGNNGWTVVPANFTHYSAPYTSIYNMENTHYYIISKTSADNNTAITIDEKGTAYSVLNFGLGYKYVIWDPSTEDWADMTSSHGNTPAQIDMTSFYMDNCTTAVANITQTTNVNTTTYSKSVTNCAYRGNSNLAYSNLSNGYKFIGWYEGNTQKNTTNSYDFNPKTETTVSARFEYRWSLKGTMLSQKWLVDNYITHVAPNGSGQDVGYVELDLPGNSSFVFKVIDRAEDDNAKKWWSCDGETFDYADDQNVAKTCTNTGEESNMTFNTAAPGTYRFTWNTSTHQLTVTYPTSYKVTYNDNGSTSGSVPADNDYYANGVTVTVKSNSGSLSKNGYTYGGWNTKADGTGTTYAAGSGTFTISQDTTLYAKWNTKTLYFTSTSGNNWSTTTNWTDGFLPTIDHDVVITKPVTVNVNNARAKSVVLDQNGDNTGSLTINAGQELVIAGSLRKTTDGSNRLATAAEDVVINSDASNGLGALVMGTHDGTNKATVYFYSKSGKNDKGKWVNQYVGTPFGNYPTAVSQFYNSWMYRIRDDEGEGNVSWLEVEPDEGLRPFKGYCIISNTNVGHTYEMQGTLVASVDRSLTLYYFGEPTMNPNNETLLANSWMAPIKIDSFAAGDFTGAEATIYIFNAGSLDDYKNAGGDPAGNTFEEGDDPGQYSTYTIGTAVNAVIPAMQSFSVFANSGATEMEGRVGKLALDFTRLVYNPAIANPDPTTPAPNKSPKRAKAETSEREEMLLYVRGANGPADRVRILAHEDFDEGFENGWDGHKIFGESFTPQLYAMTTDGNMAVNCIPEYEGTVLGFKPSDVDNSYTFYFRYDGDETLYLNDLKTEQSTLIQDENTYPFTSSVEDAEARFVISATPIPHTPTGIQSVQSDGEQGAKARKLFINGAIYIIRSGRMYDVLGKTMRNEK